jgi:hypothetical protein
MPENRIEMVIEDLDPAELARVHAREERGKRNWAWLEAHASEVSSHRGKFICIAGEELFVADTAEEALTRARAAHPEDDGCLTRYIPKERVARIYAS